MEAAEGEEIVRFHVVADKAPAHESASLTKLAGTSEQLF
jgi:hypothetical protein